MGGPGFCLFNYSVPRCVTNGPKCIYHSLVLGTDFTRAETKKIKADIKAAKPGEIVMLPHPPYAINVYMEIKDCDAHLWSEDNTIECYLTSKQKWVIIPLTQIQFPQQYTLRPGMNINYLSIRATLGFAKTIHKSQSLTEDFIIMNVNQRPRGIFAMTGRMFFVAYTRVRSDYNRRIFKPSNFNLNHLMKL